MEADKLVSTQTISFKFFEFFSLRNETKTHNYPNY
jgi:hypothetical protein